MAFSRRWALILFALVLGGGPLFAAGTREDRAYAAALAAFHDKFYDRAEAGLTQFLQTYRKSTNAPMAVLLLAQAEFHLGKYSTAIARLSASNNLARAQAAGLADRYAYWRAEAQFASGDFQGAADTFISLTDNFSNSPLGLNAVVEAAAAYEKLGQRASVDDLLDNTNGLFQRTAQLDPASELVADGRLLQSESKCLRHDFAGAIRILNLLDSTTLTPEQDWKRSHQLYRASLGLEDPDAALTATTNLLQIARHGQGGMWATNLAESVASHADVLEKEGRLAEAFAAWQENLTNSVPVGKQQQAVLKMAGLAAAQNNLPDAEAGLENYLAQFPGSPATELALLTLGELDLKDFVAQPAATNQLAAAQAKFDQLLAADTGSPLASKAFLNRGWCHWLAEKYPESLADFQAAAERLPLSEDLAVARFKMGDAQFAQTNYAGAQTNYQAVLTDFPALTNVGISLGDRALYQIFRTHLELQEATGADDAMRRLLEKFLTGTPTDNSLLLMGDGFSDFGSPAKAREVFRRFETERADSPLVPKVAFAAARTFEREQNWPAAVTNYANWLNDFPTNDLRPEVEYARNWAVFQTGDEAGAFALFTKFISQFPTNSLTPLAHWWVADHFFRLGGTNFMAAEFNYELIFQDFSTNQLAYPAQLMAGRAAMGRSQPSDASRYFVTLIKDTNCPAELGARARFAYSEALRQMTSSETNNANLQLATNILSQICQMYPTNEAGARAWSELGDCNLQLGALDAATNAYAKVFDTNSPASAAASTALRNRAQVGLGIVLEKKAEGFSSDDQKPLLALALKNYQDVFYSDAETKDEFWTKKAGLHMLTLVDKTGSLKGDDLENFITKLKNTFPQLQDSQELKRLARKN
jgi:TolA-binding protein